MAGWGWPSRPEEAATKASQVSRVMGGAPGWVGGVKRGGERGEKGGKTTIMIA